MNENEQIVGALLSCPFCGQMNAEPLMRSDTEWEVVCHTCHVSTGHSPSKLVVIDCWNQRSAPVPATIELRKAFIAGGLIGYNFDVPETSNGRSFGEYLSDEFAEFLKEQGA